jgi:hypothetical protein
MHEGCKSCLASDANSCNSAGSYGQGQTLGGGGGQGQGLSSGYTGASGGSSTQRRVQVTAKILFGSVSAISSMKNAEKATRKRSQ